MASDPKFKSQATAVVTVTLRIKADSTWGEDCTIGQVNSQAGRETVNMLRNVIHKAELGNRIEIVGEPEVKVVTTQREV